jgi:hypothetical protein
MMSAATAASGIHHAVEAAKKQADAAKAAAASAASSAGNASTSSTLTNPAVNKQDNSTLTDAGDATKEESVIDVNINVDTAEDAFLKQFGELLKEAIEKTGARVTSLENHTTELAKATESMTNTVTSA